MRRMREFTLFAKARGYGFSSNMDDYTKGTHRWLYKIFAASFKQAWYVAIHERFAPDKNRAGIRRIQFAYWHTRSRLEPGDWTVAPYLTESESARTNNVLVPTHSEEVSK